jgi:hypothetical protein
MIDVTLQLDSTVIEAAVEQPRADRYLVLRCGNDCVRIGPVCDRILENLAQQIEASLSWNQTLRRR